jgi:starvation-inducible DNA-binding protein
MNQEKLETQLNKQLANWNVLFTKLHNYHWYVTGSDFFTLHAKFEEFYNEAANYIDEIAERILTIQGKPIATLREYLEYSSIAEATGNEQAREMVSTIAEDFTTIIAESDALIKIAEELGDVPTADQFIGIKTSIEQHNWMLRAYLN